MNAPHTAGRTLPFVRYPLFLTGALLAYAMLIGVGAAPMLVAYAIAVVAALSVVLLERLDPERDDWRPCCSDIASDGAYMAVVQVALPRLLTALVVAGAADWMHANAPSALWPHHWRVALQVLAVVLAVNFLRCWLHRACHDLPVLWRLHKVHHSPDILYLVNVGRLQPPTKALHFC